MAEVAIRPVDGAAARAESPAADLHGRRAEIAATRARMTVAVDALQDRVTGDWPSMAMAGAQRAVALPPVPRMAVAVAVVIVAGVALALWMRRPAAAPVVSAPRARGARR